MLQALYAGVSGLQAHQSRMNVIGNNIANVNTVGHKGSRANFQDQLSQLVRAASASTAGGLGGTNPAQIGLGVQLGAIDTIMTQGNLQTTGKQTDLALQGNGFLMVSNGTFISYTRDGSFDLDSAGYLVNTATGQRLVGYVADIDGNVDRGAAVSPASFLQVPVGVLTDARQTQNVVFQGNLGTDLHAFTTRVDFTGNLNSLATTGPAPITTTVHDEFGKPWNVRITFSNPTNTPAPGSVEEAAGATRIWDVEVVYQSDTNPSTTLNAKLASVAGAWTFVGGTSANPQLLGATLALDGAAGPNNGPRVGGDQSVSGNGKLFSLNLNFGQIGSAAAASSVVGQTDGSADVPWWTTSSRVYDSLGVAHDIVFKFRRATLSDDAPPGAQGQWEWQALKSGAVLFDSNGTPEQDAVYFDNMGRLVGQASFPVTVPTQNGSVTPLVLDIDVNELTQLASASDVRAAMQDGYPVGTLQSFAIDPAGVILGIFSSGQTRSLGQIALATFTNPAGLERAGSNLLRETGNSGVPQVGVPNQGGRAKVSSGYLEMSNVDLSTEFTNMIVTQRGFQANTRIVTSVDELMQEVLNMKR
ncbi:MAG TPA: flagellar hook protein FlgE [Chthonomonadales bacterium]|nr:flagellar hook protein FlgE [Chthonomonadales bacterium]